MRILLDTNIIIHREASKVYNQDIGLLFHWLDKLHYEKCIHPATVDEINSYQDEEVVNTMKIKIVNYNVLRTLSQDTAQTLHLNSLDKIHLELDKLWKAVKDKAEVDKVFFDEYFATKQKGYAIAIKNVKKYKTSIDISEKYGIKAPQSFAYIK